MRRGGPPPPVFAEVFILKGDEVVCFDTDSQVFILKVLTGKAHLVCEEDTLRVETTPHPGCFAKRGWIWLILKGLTFLGARKRL